MKLPPWARRLATALLVAAAAFYLYRSIAGNAGALRRFDWEVDPLRLIASVVAHVAVLAWGVGVWGRVLRFFEHPPVGLGTLLRIWFLSSLARYIPGKVFQFLAVAQLSRAAGLSGAVLLTSLVVHTGMALLSALVLSAWTLPGALFPALPPLAVGLVATIVAGVLVHPRVLNWGVGVLRRLARRDVLRWNGRWIDGMGLLGLSVVSWILYGGAFWLLIASLTDVSAGAVPMLSGVNAFSFFVGYIAIITPAGLGPREVTMTELLSAMVPRSVAAVLSVASRLWTIAAEIVGGLLVLAFTRGGRVGSAIEIDSESEADRSRDRPGVPGG